MINSIDIKNMKDGEVLHEDCNYMLYLHRGVNVQHKNFAEFKIKQKRANKYNIELTTFHDDGLYDEENNVYEYSVESISINFACLILETKDLDEYIQFMNEVKVFVKKCSEILNLEDFKQASL